MFRVVSKIHGFQANRVSKLGFATQLAETGKAGQEKLKKTIATHMQAAPLLFLVKTKRPFKDVAELELEIHARKPEGTFACIKTRLLYLGLRGSKRNKAIPDTDLNFDDAGNLFSLVAAQDYLLQRALDKFQSAKTVAPDYEFDGFSKKCRLHKVLPADFRKSYTEVRQALARGLDFQSDEFPVLKDYEKSGPVADKQTLVFKISYAKGEDPELIDIYLSIKNLKGEIHSDSVIAIIPKRVRRGCEKADVIVKEKNSGKTDENPTGETAKKPNGIALVKVQALKLKINVPKKNYKLGERLRFSVSANLRCELNIIYKQADGKLVILPNTYEGRNFVGHKFLAANEVRQIPVDPAINITFQGPVGRESLFVQCKRGGLKQSRVDQHYVNRQNAKIIKQRGIGFSSKKTDTSHKNSYDARVVHFNINS